MAKLVRGPKFGGFRGSDFRSRIAADCDRDGKRHVEEMRALWERLNCPPSLNNVFVKIETLMLSEHDFAKFTVTSSYGSSLPISLTRSRTAPLILCVQKLRERRNILPYQREISTCYFGSLILARIYLTELFLPGSSNAQNPAQLKCLMNFTAFL